MESIREKVRLLYLGGVAALSPAAFRDLGGPEVILPVLFALVKDHYLAEEHRFTAGCGDSWTETEDDSFPSVCPECGQPIEAADVTVKPLFVVTPAGQQAWGPAPKEGHVVPQPAGLPDSSDPSLPLSVFMKIKDGVEPKKELSAAPSSWGAAIWSVPTAIWKDMPTPVKTLVYLSGFAVACGGGLLGTGTYSKQELTELVKAVAPTVLKDGFGEVFGGDDDEAPPDVHPP